MKRRAAVLYLALLVVAFAGRAGAQESDGSEGVHSMQDRALAEALFRQGKELGEAGQIHEACLKFQESQRLDPALGTLIHLATCFELEGRTASAWAAFQSAADLADRAGQADRASLARAHVAELEKRLSRLVISWKELPNGASISLDGSAVGAGVESAPLPLDPGPHTLLVTAPGKASWSQTLQIDASQSTSTVEIPPLQDEVTAPPAAPAPPPPVAATSVAPPASNGKRVMAYAVGGAGLVALVVGTVFGVRAAGQNSDANAHCRGSVCTQQGLDGHSAANTSAWIANIGVGLGIAGLAGGTYLYFTSAPSTPRVGSANAIDGFQLAARGTW